MKELDGVLGAFHEATGCAAALWTPADAGVTMIVVVCVSRNRSRVCWARLSAEEKQ